MGLFNRKKANKTPEDFAIGLPTRESGYDRSAPRPGKLLVYKAKDGWRWQLVAQNGHITADSGEAYIRRYDAKIAAERLQEVAGNARVEVVD